MVFQDRPDRPGKADLRVSYFLPLAQGQSKVDRNKAGRNPKPAPNLPLPVAIQAAGIAPGRLDHNVAKSWQ